jgi:tyrosyl-tRNA synthetase
LYGLTMPLVTKSDGNKFGKSEQGTVWLDPKKTSPYEFYQFFVRQADDDVIRFLKVFTQLSLDEIAELEESVKAEPHLRKAQKRLAEEITRVVHGEEGLKNVLQASRVLFGEKIENLDDQTIGEIFKDVPSVKKDRVGLEAGWDLVSALIDSGASPSKGQARKLIQAGGVYINNDRVQDVEKVLTVDDLASLSYLIIRTGKKNYRLIEIQ